MIGFSRVRRQHEGGPGPAPESSRSGSAVVYRRRAEALIATLKEKGSVALDALVKQPESGYIKMPNTLG
jgi:hypothetical protein